MPAQRLSRAVVELTTLGVRERAALADTLFELHTRIFAGVDRARFEAEVMHAAVDGARLVIYRTAEGRPVGYAVVKHIDLELDGRRLRIVRPVAGVERSYRGSFGDSFMATHCTRLVLTAGRRQVYMLASPISPVSYYKVHRASAEIWPRPERPTPPAIRRQMHQLADRLGLPIGRDGDPDVRRVGWVSRLTEDEARGLDESETPAIRFYLQRVPHHRDGEGLLMLVPFTARNMLGGLAFHGRRLLTGAGRARPSEPASGFTPMDARRRSGPGAG